MGVSRNTVWNLVFLWLLPVVTASNSSKRHEFFDVMFNEEYDPRIPPIHNGEPVLNTIQLYILGIDSISDSTMVNRVTGTYSCQMYLQKYPLDQQTCSIQMESYGYSTETLKFQWNDVPLLTQPNLTLPQFDIGHVTDHTCDITYNNGNSTVTFTCLGIDIEMSRNYGYYIIQVYVPSFLIVCLSWVSFWLNVDAVPARISLGLLTVLTMTTQSSGARATLPRVSYIKAIDVWMATCLLFVFAALIEFSVVNVKSRVQQRRSASLKELPLLLHNKAEANNDKTPMERTSRMEARRVDKLSRVLFPSVFFCFNLIYWTVYIMWTPDNQEH